MMTTGRAWGSVWFSIGRRRGELSVIHGAPNGRLWRGDPGFAEAVVVALRHVHGSSTLVFGSAEPE